MISKAFTIKCIEFSFLNTVLKQKSNMKHIRKALENFYFFYFIFLMQEGGEMPRLNWKYRPNKITYEIR